MTPWNFKFKKKKEDQTSEKHSSSIPPPLPQQSILCTNAGTG